MSVIIVVGLASVISGLVQSIAGFGSGIVLMLFLPRFLGVVEAAALAGVIATAATLSLAWQYRKKNDLKLTIPFSLAYICACSAIICGLSQINLRLLTLAFGVFLILMALVNLFGQNKYVPKANTSTAITCGFAGGLCSGLFGIGGPIIALFFAPTSESRESYMGNSQFCATVTAITASFVRASNGMLPVNLIPAIIAGIAGIIIGKTIGTAFSSKIKKEKLQKYIYYFVGANGVITVIQQLTAAP